MTDKNALREHARQHRAKIDPASEDVEGMSALFFEQAAPKADQIIAAYWPMGKELDIRYLIDDLIRAGHKVALPVASKDNRSMTFRLWDGKVNLIEGEYAIFIPPESEPVEPDILLIPLLAFDRRGTRLGQGQGHYDATLATLREKKEILAVGVGYAAQAVLFNLPVEPHDQRLDLVLTPKGVHDFR